MQVPYEVRDSVGRGKGLFATNDIATGTLVWDFHKANISVYSEAEAKTVCEALASEQTLDSATQLVTYAYWSLHNPDGRADGLFLVDVTKDDGRFFNHSFDPNVALGGVLDQKSQETHDMLSSYALRDIKAGEEIIDDYNTYATDPEWYDELARKCGIDDSYLDKATPNQQKGAQRASRALSTQEATETKGDFTPAASLTKMIDHGDVANMLLLQTQAYSFFFCVIGPK